MRFLVGGIQEEWLTRRYTVRAPIPPESSGSPAQYLARSEGRAGVRQPSAPTPTPQEILVGKRKVECVSSLTLRLSDLRILTFLCFFL